MERADPFVIDVDELQVVHLLQNHVAGVEKDGGARVVPHRLEKALEGGAVVEILAGVEFIADIDAGLVESIEDGSPTLPEFREGFLDQPSGALWPRVEQMPGQRAGESCMRSQAEMLARARCKLELLHGPGLALLRLAA